MAARTREKPGWYLARGIRPARRLPIDIRLDELADPSLPDRQNWEQRTQAAALSTPLALDAADRALLGSRPPAPRGGFEPGAYELQVTGLNAVTAALSCPHGPRSLTSPCDRSLSARRIGARGDHRAAAWR